MADEIVDLDEFDDDEPSDAEERLALSVAIEALEKRCKAKNVHFEGGLDEDGDPYAIITLGDQRESRPIRVWTSEKAKLLLDMPFENYKFLRGYEGICNYKSGYVEVALWSSLPVSVVLRKLSRSLRNSSESLEILPPTSASDRPTLNISPRSKDFRALAPFRGGATTLKLSGTKSQTMDDLLQEVRSYSDSLMMQIDAILGSTFFLQRSRKLSNKIPVNRSIAQHGITYPEVRYNETAASLYWYAKSAREMPLLRFLAFYQSVEYYFPRYSTIEARKRVSSIIKNPSFRMFNDDDIDKIVSSVRIARGGGLGDERSQLRAVIGECISSDDMRSYLESDSEIKDHFSGKSRKYKYHKIPIENQSADLRNDAADRIYTIRCKIVHTKSSDDSDGISMLVPFSEEADYLARDIDLMEFVAKAVLVASSGGMT